MYGLLIFERKPKQTLLPWLDVVSAVSGASVAPSLTFRMSPDVSLDVPGFKNQSFMLMLTRYDV